MELEERTSIDATPEDVFGFFEDMAENYKRWHPNHITFRWVDGDGLEPGATS
ncbi:MAG: SRPBCC family protein [Natrialbaceae archaeon]|nr:SRPBCC family protein [Natrialbaceae archaeon]